jgi:hypothetical protein
MLRRDYVFPHDVLVNCAEFLFSLKTSDNFIIRFAPRSIASKNFTGNALNLLLSSL